MIARRHARFFITLASLLVLIALIFVAAPQPGRTAETFMTITTGQLKSMVDAKKPMLLIDARTSGEYQEAHIEGAVSMPERTFDDHLSMLPADKGALLVLYCNGVKCGKSKKAAGKAAAKGYTNILVYSEGFPVWEENGYKIVAGPEYAKKVETTKIPPAELKGLQEKKKDAFVLVDVRDESEFHEGHIPGAINIPAETFASRSEVLPKEKKIIVYCNSGGRSYTAYRKLMKLGYSDIAQTLFADWKEAGMSVEK